MSDIGEFFRGAAAQFPGAINRANQFEIDKQSVDARTKNAESLAQGNILKQQANKIQQQTETRLAENQKQQQDMQGINLTMSALKNPNKQQQKAMLDFLVKQETITQDFATMSLKTSDEARAEAIKILGSDASASNKALALMNSNMADLIVPFNKLENAGAERALKEAQAGKARAETNLITGNIESRKQTANILSGGGGQQAQPKSFTQGTGDFLGLNKLPPVAAGTQALLDKVDAFRERFPVTQEDELMTQEELSSASTEELQEIARGGKVDLPSIPVERIKINNVPAHQKTVGTRLNKLIAKDKKDSAMIAKLQSLTNPVAIKKVTQLQTERRANREEIKAIRRNMQKGFPSKIASDLAKSRTILKQLERIDNLYNEDFVGLIQGKEFKIPFGPELGRGLDFKKFSQEEADFRAEVGLLKVKSRKEFFGATQTALELKGSLDSIPDVGTATEEKFLAAMKVVRKHTEDLIAELEKAGAEARFSGGRSIENP